MKNVVCVYGESIAGDGYTWFYDSDTGEFITFFEYEGEGDGYIEALEDMGVSYRYLYLDAGESKLSWGELADWWEKVRYESLTAIVKDAEKLKLETVWRG